MKKPRAPLAYGAQLVLQRAIDHFQMSPAQRLLTHNLASRTDRCGACGWQISTQLVGLRYGNISIRSSFPRNANRNRLQSRPRYIWRFFR